jgi:hypothetical protein
VLLLLLLRLLALRLPLCFCLRHPSASAHTLVGLHPLLLLLLCLLEVRQRTLQQLLPCQ